MRQLVLKENNRLKNFIRQILVVSLMLFICGICISCGKSNKKDEDINANITNTNEVMVDFINVGKGDCIIIRTLTHVIMIDTGYEETSSDVIKFLNDNGITKIDTMIITHYDKDHVGGATDIIKSFDVDEIIMPDYIGQGSKYIKFMEKLEKWDKTNLINYLTEDISLEFDNITLDLYPAKETEYELENNYSIVTKLTNNEDTFLFTGDAQAQRINEILGEKMLDCDVLKLPYHGNLENNYIEFIDEVSPKYGVITCEAKKDVSNSIINELEDLKTKYYLNCDGNIHCTSDGCGNIEFTQ